MKDISKYSVNLALVAFSAYTLASNLGGLSGFNLNGYLALADRFAATGRLFYSSGAADNYVYSQIYFPGFALLATPFAYLFPRHAVDCLHILSAVLILLFVGLLIAKCVEFGVDKYFAIVSVPLVLVSFLPAILWYAADYKPDVFLMAIYLFGSFVLSSRQSILKKSLALLLLSLIGIITKQQFIGLWFGQFLVILIWRRNFERKALVLSAVLGLVLGILILVQIENLTFHAIRSVLHHRFYGPVNLGSLVYLSLSKCYPLVICMVLYFFSFRKDHIPQNQREYLLVCLTWAIFPLASMAKVGGTEENFYTAIVLAVPLCLLGLVKSCSIETAYKDAAVMVTAFIIVLIFSFGTAKALLESSGRFALKQDIVRYISTKYAGMNLVHDETSYPIIRELNSPVKTSMLVVDTYKSMGHDISQFESNFKNGYYGFIITSHSGRGGDPLKNWLSTSDHFAFDRSFEYRDQTYFIYSYNNQMH